MLVQVCLNGSRAPGEHPRLPVQPDDLAREARRAVDAGAGAIHAHPRDVAGTESLEPEDCAAVINAMRRACPGIGIGLTTGLWIVGDVQPRLELVKAWSVLPDFVSVNFSEEGADELVSLLLDRGVGIEAGLGSLEDAHRLLGSGIAERCLRVLVEIDGEEDADRAVATAAAISSLIDQSAPSVPQLHHGSGRATWAVLEQAIMRRHDIRVGLEDTLLHADGRLAADNRELVAAAVRLVERQQT